MASNWTDAWIEYGTSSIDGGIAMTMLIAAPLCGALEGGGLLQFGYSKFADKSIDFSPSIPSRLGMVLIYAPAMLVPPVYALATGFLISYGNAVYNYVVAFMLFAHFGKRVLECLFVHRYSGNTKLGSTLTISGLYAVTSFIFLRATLRPLDDSCGWMSLCDPNQRSSPLLYTGLVLFIIGTIGNFYHHLLLRNLRPPGGSKYVVPTGGLFRHVCCPHYFCEIVTWWGIVLATGQMNGLATMWMMMWYLGGRSHSTMKWYREKETALMSSEDFTLHRGWKRMYPFVF